MLLVFSLSVSSKNHRVDIKSSTLEWEAKKVTGQHVGTIAFGESTLIIEKKKITGANLTVDMNTIVNTDLTDSGYNQKLIGHLKSDDFFGVDKFPIASFVLDKTSLIKKGTSYINGKITIKGVTQPIVIKAVITDTPDGQRIYANITIDRTKFNLKYGSGSFFDNLGDKTIYDDMNLGLNLLMKKQ